MKKLFLAAFVAMTATVASAAIGILRPMVEYFDETNLSDGEYPVAFDATKVTTTSKGVYITFDIYTLDEYRASDLKQLAPGDQIGSGDGVTEVKTVTKDANGYYSVNEGLDDELYFIAREEGSNIFTLCGDDDRATYSKQGTVRMLVPVTVKFRDGGYSGNPLKERTVLGKNLGKYLRSSNNNFDEFNTRIKVKNGKIVGMRRVYTP